MLPDRFLRLFASSSTLGAFVAHSYAGLLFNSTLFPLLTKLDPRASIAALLAISLLILLFIGNIVQVRETVVASNFSS